MAVSAQLRPVPAPSSVLVVRLAVEMPFPVAALLCRDPWPLLFDVASGPFDVLARNHTSVSMAAASTYRDTGAAAVYFCDGTVPDSDCFTFAEYRFRRNLRRCSACDALRDMETSGGGNPAR